MASRTRTRTLAALPLGLALLGCSFLGTGCGEKPKQDVSSASSSAAPPQLDGKLNAAVNAVSSANASGNAAQSGPPPSGVFGPGEADKALAVNAPPKLDIISEGSDPKISLRPKLPPADQATPLIVVLTASAPQQRGREERPQALIPPLQISLLIGTTPGKAAPAKTDAKAGDKPKAAPAASAAPSAAPVAPPADAPGGGRIYATFADVTMAGGVENAPKEMLEMLTKLKGANVSFLVNDGGPYDFKASLPGEPSLDIAFTAVEEALSLLYVPGPEKPIGEGGSYIVADRHTSFGIETVRYRVFKIEKLNGTQATMSLDLKQYAVSSKMAPGGLLEQVAKMTLMEYATLAKGELVTAPGKLYPDLGQLQILMQQGFDAGEKNGKKATAGIALKLQTIIGKVPSRAAGPGDDAE